MWGSSQINAIPDNENKEDNIELCCPILKVTYNNPVLLPTGQSVDFEAMITWLTSKSTNPFSPNHSLTINQLIPNPGVQLLVEAYQQKKPLQKFFKEKAISAMKNLNNLMQETSNTSELLSIDTEEKLLEFAPLWPFASICPLTLEKLVEPVTTPDSITYSKHAITQWLEVHDQDPLTGRKLNKNELINNIKMRDLVESLAQHPILQANKALSKKFKKRMGNYKNKIIQFYQRKHHVLLMRLSIQKTSNIALQTLMGLNFYLIVEILKKDQAAIPPETRFNFIKTLLRPIVKIAAKGVNAVLQPVINYFDEDYQKFENSLRKCEAFFYKFKFYNLSTSQLLDQAGYPGGMYCDEVISYLFKPQNASWLKERLAQFDGLFIKRLVEISIKKHNMEVLHQLADIHSGYLLESDFLSKAMEEFPESVPFFVKLGIKIHRHQLHSALFHHQNSTWVALFTHHGAVVDVHLFDEAIKFPSLSSSSLSIEIIQLLTKALTFSFVRYFKAYPNAIEWLTNCSNHPSEFAKHFATEVLELLLEAGAPVNGRKNDHTPIINALESRDINKIRLLMQFGALQKYSDLITDSFIEKLVQFCIEKQDRETLVQLANITPAYLTKGDVLIHAMKHFPDSLPLFLKAGAKIKDSDLSSAIFDHHSVAYVSLFLAHGAKVGVALFHQAIFFINHSKTPLILVEIIRLLMNSSTFSLTAYLKSYPTSLQELANSPTNFATAVLRLLLEAGAPVNGVENDRAPLINAITRCDANKVKLLIEFNARVNPLYEGSNAEIRQFFQNKNALAIITLLLEAGAHPNSMIGEGSVTVMEAAVASFHSPIIRKLMKYGGIIDTTKYSNVIQHLMGRDETLYYEIMSEMAVPLRTPVINAETSALMMPTPFFQETTSFSFPMLMYAGFLASWLVNKLAICQKPINSPLSDVYCQPAEAAAERHLNKQGSSLEAGLYYLFGEVYSEFSIQEKQALRKIVVDVINGEVKPEHGRRFNSLASSPNAFFRANTLIPLVKEIEKEKLNALPDFISDIRKYNRLRKY